MSRFITVEKSEFIGLVTISRPEARNALSLEVVKELNAITKSFHDDKALRCVVFIGSGDKAFSAGADLKERQDFTEVETLQFVEGIQRTFQHIAELPMPTIAAINGDAFGGGLELALACDIRILSKKAKVGLTECGWGIIPGAGGTQRLPRIVGLSRAMDLIFGARRINADEAFFMGLVNYLANDHEETRKLALDVAKNIATNAPLAVRSAKVALVASLEETSLHDGLVRERASYHEILETEDRREGLKAFREKRLPQFRGA